MIIIRRKFAVAVLVLLSFTFIFDAAAQQAVLKKTFADYFLIGAALNHAQIFEQDKVAAKIIETQFNTISPENVLKWSAVHPQPDQFDFKAADRYVTFGEQRRMIVIGHTLVWHNQTPDWVFKDARGQFVSRDELLNRLRAHIQTVVGRYKGRIKGWDVVNEALNDDGSLRQTPWLKIIGSDYIAKAFEFAHEADPQAELYYNDYSLEIPAKRRGAIALMKNLLAQKVPITAIGLQNHDNLNFPTTREEDQTITDFAALGLKVNITELDVSVLPDPKGFNGAEVAQNFRTQAELDPYKAGLPIDVQQKLANRYAELFRVFIAHRQDIRRVTFWNVTDKESWLNNFPVRGRTNYPLLFDREGNSKLAFNAVIQSILNKN